MLALYLSLSAQSFSRASATRNGVRRPPSTPWSCSASAAVALLVVGWATHTDLVGKLLDSVMSNLTGKVK
ncbi:MAG: hypothetical protein JOZ68_12280 [Acidimicrobiia bacterium]|nr:hypothetical protein [Acidimicrobiia bacterium]MBV9041777.1 hypothetical protein [Acidimicrobiia bacterium]